MDEDNSKRVAGPEVWRQWNQALAKKLGAGGTDLGGQAQALAEAAEAARQRGDRQALWAALNALTKISLGLQRVETALLLATEALALAEDLFGPDSGQAGTVLGDLIFIEALQGREPRAVLLAQRLGAIVLAQVREGLDQAFAYNLTSLATFHAMRGEDDLAEGLLRRVIRLGEGQAETDPDLLLFVYDNLASFCQARGDAAKAQEARQRAMRIMEEAGYPHASPAGTEPVAKPEKTTIH